MARGRRLLEQEADLNGKRVFNPPVPADPLDITALRDLSPQYATAAAVEADALVRGDVVFVTGVNAPYFYSSTSSATVDHVTVLNGPGGVGRWLLITQLIALGANAVVITDANGHITTDTPGLLYLPASGGNPSQLNVGAGGGGTASAFFSKIGGLLPGLKIVGANSNNNPLTNGQPFFAISNAGGNWTGCMVNLFGSGTPVSGITAIIDGSIQICVPDFASSGGSAGGLSIWADLAQTKRVAKFDVQGAHGSTTLDGLAGATAELVLASTTGQLARAVAGTNYQPALSATAGSVLFSGGGAVISQDNPNFFWDAVNHRLIIKLGGTYTPAAGAPLTISGADASTIAVLLNQSATQDIEKLNGRLGVGTGDANAVDIITNGTPRITVAAGGAATVAALAGLANGALTADASGLLQKVPTLRIVDDAPDNLVNVTATGTRALALGAGGVDDWVLLNASGQITASGYGGSGSASLAVDPAGVVSRVARAATQSFSWSGIVGSGTPVNTGVGNFYVPADAGMVAVLPPVTNGGAGGASIPAVMTMGSPAGRHNCNVQLYQGPNCNFLSGGVYVPSALVGFANSAVIYQWIVWRINAGGGGLAAAAATAGNYVAMAGATTSGWSTGDTSEGLALTILAATLNSGDGIFATMQRIDGDALSNITSVQFAINARFG